MTYSIVEKNKQNIISQEGQVANTFFKRLVGLMFKKSIGPEYALIFYNATSIHTFFMRFPIDIIFLDKNNQIIRISQALKPWRMVFCSHSKVTIELPAHKTKENSSKVGDFLEILPKKPLKAVK
jgi:uncharacterized membrane protein (UPF0127 family)